MLALKVSARAMIRIGLMFPTCSYRSKAEHWEQRVPPEDNLSDARAIILIAEAAVGHAAAEFATANGLNVAQAEFANGATTIRTHPRPAAVLIDIREAGPDALNALPEVTGAALDAALALVVVFDRAQLDDVAGLLLGGETMLLCDPEPAELAAALAVAVNDPDLIVRDSSREALRLQRLNEEVARFAATLVRLSDQTDAPLERPRGTDPFVADRSTGFDAQPLVDLNPTDIRRAIRARRLRDDAFDLPGLFEDPAWDMLLDLFAAELERTRVSVSSLCIAAAVAPTTALRWIGKLIEAGLLDRRPDDFDRRRAFLSLTARASTAMRNYVAAIRRAGLAIA